jgi:multiple sugar transport system substrate-binding protein
MKETVMSIRGFRAIALFAAGLLTSTALFAQTTVTFRFHDVETTQMRQALDEFEKQNPGIKVNMQRGNWADARQQYLREAAVGSAPDVVQIVYVWARPFAAAKAIRPLDDLIAKGGLGIKGWDDFIARDLAAGPDGKTYAVPFATDTFALMYNTDMLAAAGIKSPPKTWTELFEMSRMIRERTGKLGFAFPSGSCGTPAIWFYLNFYWWSKGVNLVEEAGGGKFRIGTNAAQVADAFSYFNAYVREGLNPASMASACSFGSPEVVEGLLNGEFAIVSLADFTAARVLENWKKRHPDKPSPFRTTIHPADVKPSTTHFGGRMVALGPNPKNLDAAWNLVQFLTKAEPTFTRFLTGYTPSQYEALKTKQPEPGMEGFRDQLLLARSWGAYATGPVDIPTMWNASGRAIGSVLIRQKTAEQAAQEFVALLQAELAKHQK